MINICTSPLTKETKIEFWQQQSPVGQLVIARTKHGICYIGLGQCVSNLKDRFKGHTLLEIKNSIELDHIEALHLRGTDFQMAVWRALLEIPIHHRVSYAYIAQQIGRPRAIRAVGSAVGANPVSLVIPCHRVIRKDGSLGGYFWGLDLKSKILAYEDQISVEP